MRRCRSGAVPRGSGLIRGTASTIDGFVSVGHRFICSACEPVGQHGGGGRPWGPWIVAFEHERQTSGSSLPSSGRTPSDRRRIKERGSGMDLVHPRCAGLDVSMGDAKLCVRIAGSGRAAATSTVTTWGAVTNQVLALREALDRRAGDAGGDGGNRRLLEAVRAPRGVWNRVGVRGLRGRPVAAGRCSWGQPGRGNARDGGNSPDNVRGRVGTVRRPGSGKQ